MARVFYVRADADGGSDGSEPTVAKAWTPAEYLLAATSGAAIDPDDFVYPVAVGGAILSSGFDQYTRDGSAIAPHALIGCYEEAGDLDRPSYNVDGTLNTAYYPLFAFSSSGRLNLSGADYMHVRNLRITGECNQYLLYMGNNSTVSQVSITNTNTSSGAFCLFTGTIGDVHDCDFHGPASGGGALAESAGGTFVGCRFMNAPNLGLNVTGNGLVVVGCTFFRPVGTAAIAINHASSNVSHELSSVSQCTIVGGWDIGIRSLNFAHARLLSVTNCHITGCRTAGIKTLHTDLRAGAFIGNRFRNNGDGNIVGYDKWLAASSGRNVETAGSDAGDFVNPAVYDYRLRYDAAGATAAIGGLPAGSRGVLMRRPPRTPR